MVLKKYVIYLETFDLKVNHQTLFSVDKPVEFYLIGEIVGGTGFPDGVSCAYKIVAGSQWMLQEGKPEEELCSGQTQISFFINHLYVV